MINRVLIIIIALTFIFSGCSKNSDNTFSADNQGTIVAEIPTLEITTEPTLDPTAEVTIEPTIAPTPIEESYDYIDDLTTSETFDTLFLERWNYKTKTDPFTMNNLVYTHGIGMFILSKEIMDEKGSHVAVWNLDKKYNKISFDLGCEQSMGYDIEEKYGTYEIIIYADDKEVWKSDKNDYAFVDEDIKIDINNCDRLEVKLIQYKGKNGTLNIVMGNFKLYKDS